VRIICQKNVNRGKGVDRCTKIERMEDKKLLSAWWEMKKEWGRELCVCCFHLNERSAVAWFRLRVWKLIGLREGVERVICPFC
jgi:hypothetical protein